MFQCTTSRVRCSFCITIFSGLLFQLLLLLMYKMTRLWYTYTYNFIEHACHVAHKPMHFVFSRYFAIIYISSRFSIVFLSICRCVLTKIETHGAKRKEFFFSDTINNVSYTLHRGNEQSPNKKIS